MMMEDPDTLGWDLDERDAFMKEYGDRDDIEPEIEVIVEADE